MKRSFSILSVLGFSLFMMFTSCKKGRAEFTIKGFITDQSFNTGLSGVTAYLYEIPAGGGNLNQVASAVLSNGNYEFTVSRDQVEGYIIRVNKPNYFDHDEAINFSTLSIENDNIVNFSVYAKSWVNLHFVNINGQPTDELRYTKVDGYQGCSECCPTDEQIISGDVDTMIYCINRGNTTYSYNYVSLPSGAFGTESITTTPFDTVELLLDY